MDAATLRLSFEGGDAALAGMCAQELRQQILDKAPPGVNIALQQCNQEAMGFPGDVMVIHAASALLIDSIFKIIEQYRRPPGLTLRVDVGGRMAILDDVNPKAVKELQKLKNGLEQK
jgi:hypothetical protein